MSRIYAIATVTEYVRRAIDNKSTGQACFSDLGKKFDTIDHENLLIKFEAFCFRLKL